MKDELKPSFHPSAFILPTMEGLMSDKDRRKKDGERKDKNNKQTRESENEVVQTASAPQQARDASNLTDRQPGPRSTRETEKEGR
jgi:hypothetical protein